MNAKSIVGGFLLLLLLEALTVAQTVDTTWVKYCSRTGNGLARARAVTLDLAGNVYVTGNGEGYGTLEDYTTIKYNAVGDSLWLAVYDGPINSVDIPAAMTIDTSAYPMNALYVTGMSIGGAVEDFATISYKPNGDTNWVRRYDGPANGSDYPKAISFRNGYVYAAGTSLGVGTSNDFATIKYDTLGTVQWVRRFNGPGNGFDMAVAVDVDAMNYVYVTGWTQTPTTHTATIKYTPSGDTAWVRVFNSASSSTDIPVAIAADELGNVFVAGYRQVTSSDYDFMLIKYNANGDTVWTRSYNGTGNGNDFLAAMKRSPLGNIVVTGSSLGVAGRTQYVTIEYLNNGLQAWTAIFQDGEIVNDAPSALAVDSGGNVYVTGSRDSSTVTKSCLTIKYDSNGSLKWARKYLNVFTDASDSATCIAVDSYQNAYVAGQSLVTPGSFSRFVTMRYSFLGPLVVVTYSPVNVKVTDPDELYIGLDPNDILQQTLFPATYYNDMGPTNVDSVVIPYPIAGEYTIEIIPEADAPSGSTYSVGIRIDGSTQCILITGAAVPASGTTDTYHYSVADGWHYENGDANDNGLVNIQDVTFLINFLYKAGPEPFPREAGDSNCNGLVNIQDITYLINFLYKSGPSPCRIN